MMKIINFSLLVVLISLTTNCFAQKKGKSDTNAESQENMNLYKVNKKVYNLGLKYNDLGVAKQAVYQMLAEKPNKTELLDTLAYLYYNNSDFVQVVLIGREILNVNPKKATMLELVAVSEQNLGLTKQALESFEKLYALTGNIYHQYNMASLQYMLKRYGECGATLNEILSSEDNSSVISIADDKGEAQKVPIKAAAFNMRGVVAMDIGKMDIAQQNFAKALEIFPEFRLAKFNLAKVTASIENAEK